MNAVFVGWSGGSGGCCGGGRSAGYPAAGYGRPRRYGRRVSPAPSGYVGGYRSVGPSCGQLLACNCCANLACNACCCGDACDA